MAALKLISHKLCPYVQRAVIVAAHQTSLWLINFRAAMGVREINATAST